MVVTSFACFYMIQAESCCFQCQWLCTFRFWWCERSPAFSRSSWTQLLVVSDHVCLDSITNAAENGAFVTMWVPFFVAFRTAHHQRKEEKEDGPDMKTPIKIFYFPFYWFWTLNQTNYVTMYCEYFYYGWSGGLEIWRWSLKITNDEFKSSKLKYQS